MYSYQEVASQCRTPEIMADAAYVILTRDARNFTGILLDKKSCGNQANALSSLYRSMQKAQLCDFTFTLN